MVGIVTSLLSIIGKEANASSVNEEANAGEHQKQVDVSLVDVHDIQKEVAVSDIPGDQSVIGMDKKVVENVR